MYIYIYISSLFRERARALSRGRGLLSAGSTLPGVNPRALSHSLPQISRICVACASVASQSLGVDHPVRVARWRKRKLC